MFNYCEFFSGIDNIDKLKKELLERGIIFQEYNDNESHLLILKYDKLNPKCNLSDEFTSYCRGMVIDLDSLKLVCVPPEKAFKYSELIPCDINYEKMLFEEFYDGTMINVWYHNDKWYISTRSRINADCKWFSDKTFYELFMEAIKKENIELELLNKNICHSFVLKHKDNRIVKKYDDANVTLVHCVNMKTLKVIKNEVIRKMYLEEGQKIEIAKSLSFKNMNNIISYMNNLSYETPGVVIKYNNYRTKIRNQNYNFVKNIRGNTPKLLNHYLDLKNKNMIKQYLYYFPEYKNEFNEFQQDIFKSINLLHHLYKGRHIYKKETSGYLKNEDIPYEYKPLVYELHGQYLNTRIKITFEYVKMYFNLLPIPRILFVLNYNKN